ncbi:hypothetical protein [Azorhizophilus paspali]|uniref:DUF2946 domain-containing protein n=1 Tax=Azorhizophilus paspali TaxID=69963 RepID=A0ABV6SJD6_AZOPA
MSGSSRHRPVFVPCLAALALLLAMSLMLVLTSLGELHDFSHAPFGAHADLGFVSAPNGDPGTHAQADGENGDAFHALLHSAHCAGHVAQLALAAFPRLTVVPAGPARVRDETPLLPASPLNAPFRPPIAA